MVGTYPVICGLLAEKPSRLSQAMHNAAFREQGLPYFYSGFETTDTQGALAAMRTLGIRGYSLTIPHKEAAMPLVDEVSDEVRAIGATNTIVNSDNRLKAYNTDWLGIQSAFAEKNVSLKGKRILIVGAGGATRAALFAFQESEIVAVLARTPSKAEGLEKDFGAPVYDFDEKLDLSALDILVNASPIGSGLRKDSDMPFPVSVQELPKTCVVFDMVTREKTQLLEEAKGRVTISGPRMLLHQATEQFMLFTGEKARPVDVMEKALYAELG